MGSPSTPIGPHHDADSFIRHKGLSELVQGARFGADSQFANVTLYSPGQHPALGVPNEALIYEGDQVRVWVARNDKSIELRLIRPVSRTASSSKS